MRGAPSVVDLLDRGYELGDASSCVGERLRVPSLAANTQQDVSCLRLGHGLGRALFVVVLQAAAPSASRVVQLVRALEVLLSVAKFFAPVPPSEKT